MREFRPAHPPQVATPASFSPPNVAQVRLKKVLLRRDKSSSTPSQIAKLYGMKKIALVCASLLVLTVSCSNQIQAPEPATLTSGKSATTPAPNRMLVAADVRACTKTWEGLAQKENRLIALTDCLEGKASGKTPEKTTCEMIFTRGGELNVKTIAKTYQFISNPTDTSTSISGPGKNEAGVETTLLRLSKPASGIEIVFTIGSAGNELSLNVNGGICRASLE